MMRKKLEIKIPETWQASGGLYEHDGNHVHDYLLLKNGDAYIDVSWTPEGRPEGQYICRGIGWTEEEKKTLSLYLETESPEAAAQWVREVLTDH